VLVVIKFKRKILLRYILNNIDKWDLLIGACLGVAFSSYVFSIIYTSVAATLFILSTTPLIAALLSWIVLNEKPTFVVSIAMVTSLVGVTVMVYEGLSLDRNLGNGLALLSALFFAVMLVVTRRSYKLDVLTGTCLGGFFSGVFGCLASIFLTSGLYVSQYDLIIMFVMGAFAIGIGISLVTIAAPFIPSSEVSVLVLLESVLGPIWVWTFLNESMSGSELAGGFIILLSVAILSYRQGSKNVRIKHT
jgi:DME family drug/metabolite transporter